MIILYINTSVCFFVILGWMDDHFPYFPMFFLPRCSSFIGLQAKAASMFDKVVASMGLTEYAKLVGPCLDTDVIFLCAKNMVDLQ